VHGDFLCRAPLKDWNSVMSMTKARLILEDGRCFEGRVFAMAPDVVGEVIFNTAMVGYQEVLTDPSYSGQLVVLTYPLIGSYGINPDDIQSKKLHLSALLVKEYIDIPSNWRSKMTLKAYLIQNKVLGVEGLDTRAITRHLRDKGAMKSCLTTSSESVDVLLEKLQQRPDIVGQNLVKNVSTKESYAWKTPEKSRYKVAVIDCGVKYGILDQLVACDCDVTCVPYDTKADVLLTGGFDGILVSNGPGDPEPVTETVETVRQLVGKIPLFGICLGHQILCISQDISICKLPFGHHGINHPVQNVATGAVEITSQNHIYCATKTATSTDFEVSHINLNDQTISGVRFESQKAFSVQYHPEAAPGPSDSHYLFQEFCYVMQNGVFPPQEKV